MMPPQLILQRKIIRDKDAARYLCMSRIRFDREVKPNLKIIHVGKQGVGFYQLTLDQWFETFEGEQKYD